MYIIIKTWSIHYKLARIRPQIPCECQTVMTAVRNGTMAPPPPPALLTLEFPAALFVCGTGAGPTGDGSAYDIASLHEIFRQFRLPWGNIGDGGLGALAYIS